MNRTNIYLTEQQVDRLDARARVEKVSRAELIRQVIDRALDGDADRLEADLTAIDFSFAALRDAAVDIDRDDGARGAHLARIAALGST
ncbi:MAG: CopG family transcriptional regulator [Phycicoccus sp.]